MNAQAIIESTIHEWRITQDDQNSAPHLQQLLGLTIDLLKNSDEFMRFVVGAYRSATPQAPAEAPIDELSSWFANLALSFSMGWDARGRAERRLLV